MTQPTVDIVLRERLTEIAADDAALAVVRALRDSEGSGAPFALSAIWDFVTGAIPARPPHLNAWLADPRRRAALSAMLTERATARSGPLKAAATGPSLRRTVGAATAELRAGDEAMPPLLVLTGLGDKAVSHVIVIADADVCRIDVPPAVEGRAQVFLPPGEPEAARFVALFAEPDAEIVLL